MKVELQFENTEGKRLKIKFKAPSKDLGLIFVEHFKSIFKDWKLIKEKVK